MSSINPRLRYADNFGWKPCLPPELLAAALWQMQKPPKKSLQQKIAGLWNEADKAMRKSPPEKAVFAALILAVAALAFAVGMTWLADWLQ